jgi:hyperosmotically inducible protein
MKKTSVNTGKFIKVLGLALSLAALPLLVGVTGCTTTTNHPNQSRGERIDDQAISSRVQDALATDPLYKFGGVNVETFKGTVQLSGFVTAREQKSRAGELARNVVGVKEVENNITVKESEN